MPETYSGCIFTSVFMFELVTEWLWHSPSCNCS